MFRNLQEEEFLDGVRELAVGKATSSMLQIALDMDLFSKIQGRSVTLDEFAALLSIPAASARLMSQFLCREGLLVYRNGLLANAPVTDKFLGTDNLVRREIRNLLRQPWGVEELRAKLINPADLHHYQMLTEEQFYIKNNPRRVFWGEELADRYDFGPHRVLLDVAGASGGFCIGIRNRNPHLRCILFDLPKSEPFAERCIAEADHTGEITFVGGSFLTDDLPKGADVAVIANVLHNWSPEEDRLILGKIHDALEPGGKLLAFEYFFEDDWTGTMEAVLQAFILSGKGWQPSFGEMETLMKDAGFADLERRHSMLLIGTKRP